MTSTSPETRDASTAATAHDNALRFATAEIRGSSSRMCAAVAKYVASLKAPTRKQSLRVMSAVRPALAALALTAPLLTYGTAVAADRVFSLPPGWWVDPTTSPYALRRDTLVVAVVNSNLPVSMSRIVQIRGVSGSGPTTTVMTDVPGRAEYIEVAPDEQRVLVHSYPVGISEGQVRATMLNAAGSVLWSQEGPRQFAFSTSGAALLSTSAGGRYLGPVLQAHNSGGTLIGTLSLVVGAAGAESQRYEEPRGACLVEAGESVIVATRTALARYSFSSPPTLQWTSQNQSCTKAYTGARVFDVTRVVAERSDGGFELVRVADGVVEYTFDPAAMDQADNNPAMTRNDWASYQVYPGSTPDTATLFNRTSSAFSLNLRTGVCTPLPVDVSTPAGHEVRRQIDGGRMVVLGANEVRIRPVPGF